MTKYIERQYLLDTIDAMIVYRKTPTDIYEMVEDALTIDVVRCKDCKHKPTGTGVNHDIEFPDDVCPCQCEDYWYSWMPQDDFFCKWGRKKAE